MYAGVDQPVPDNAALMQLYQQLQQAQPAAQLRPTQVSCEPNPTRPVEHAHRQVDARMFGARDGSAQDPPTAGATAGRSAGCERESGGRGAAGARTGADFASGDGKKIVVAGGGPGQRLPVRTKDLKDGDRIWDGHQYRTIRRCPHGRVRKDLCKLCGGAAICEHGNRRYHCRECADKGLARGICEHKRERRRCVDCGGADICEHKQIRHICRECQKAGTGGKYLCEHGQQKQHCKQCASFRPCVHKVERRLCPLCSQPPPTSKAGKCPHGTRRDICAACKEIRANPGKMADRVHQLIAFLESEQFPGQGHPQHSAMSKIKAELRDMALAHAPAPSSSTYGNPDKRNNIQKDLGSGNRRVPVTETETETAPSTSAGHEKASDAGHIDKQAQDAVAVGAITMDGALEGKESGEKLAGCKKAKETESSGGLGATMEAKEESAFMCCQHGQYGAGDWLWVPANALKDTLAVIRADKDVRSADSLKAKRLKRQARGLCEHKRERRRCVDCGGSDICEHKRIRHICRECQKAGTGGKYLCVHGQQKQHCKNCAGLRTSKADKNITAETGGGGDAGGTDGGQGAGDVVADETAEGVRQVDGVSETLLPAEGRQVKRRRTGTNPPPPETLITAHAESCASDGKTDGAVPPPPPVLPH